MGKPMPNDENEKKKNKKTIPTLVNP